MDMFDVLMYAGPAIVVGSLGLAGLRKLRSNHGRARAAREVPKLAKELGLEFTQSRDFDEVGELEGMYQGYEVSIDVGENWGSVRVRWRGGKKYALDLATAEPDERPEKGFTEFSTTVSQFDGYIGQRYAGPQVAQRFAAQPELLSAIAGFCDKWSAAMTGVTFDEYGARCQLQPPQMFRPEVLRGVLTDTVELAYRVESALEGLAPHDDDGDYIDVGAVLSHYVANQTP